VANQASGHVSGTVIQAATIKRLIMQAGRERRAVGLGMPRAAACFVNRDGVHKEADEARARSVAAGEPTQLCFHGPGGIGTTDAAVIWAGRHKDEYSDGVAFIKLSNPDRDERESAGEALGSVLMSFGFAPEDILPTADERAAQLRDFSIGKKLLIVLDDVINAAQVAYFRLTGAGCALVVTSRWLLRDLGPDFRYIRVDERGWDALDEDAKQLLTTHLDIAYNRLSHRAVAAYRALAWHPGADFDVALAIHILAGDADDAADDLDSLVDAGLLTIEDDRCRFHDLAQAHARAKTDGSSADLSRRIVEWYLEYTVTFDRTLSSRPRSGPLYQREPSVHVTVARADALALLERERANLSGAVKLADAAGHDDLVWQLCEALWGLYHLHSHYEDWVDTHQLGLAAAARCGDTEAEMRMASQLGSAHLGLAELDRALQCFRNSQRLAERIGHRQGQESALEWQGKIALRGGDAREALRCFNLAWEVADDPREFAVLRLQRCRALLVLGEFAAARDEIVAAGQYFAPTAETDNKAKCQLELGRALAGLGESDAARAAFVEAVRLFAEDGSERQRKVAEDLRNQLDSEQV
jgi:tetratricopeptide (TPR) repeat protein